VAVATGCRPNHLDWHPTFSHYAAAKQRILAGQEPHDVAVLNTLDPETASWRPLVRGKQLPLFPLEELPELGVPGRHNRINAACAAAAAIGAGCAPEAIRQGLTDFRGLPERIECCGVVAGRRFYNDSTATTPQATVAALDALEEPIWLLAGGRDKGCDFTELIAAVGRRVRGAAFFGSAAEMLRSRIAGCGRALPHCAVETLDEALRWCWDRSRLGDAILLSPGCSSHDQFRSFRQRGERFAALVAELGGYEGDVRRRPERIVSRPAPPY
jgi:UDP-N-acetylmuramoylalanine--D-glutamate ligase